MERRRVFGTAVGLLDRAFAAVIQANNRRERAAVASLTVEQRLAVLDDVTAMYADRELFAPPPACVPALREVRPRTFDGAWDSGFVPLFNADRYLAHVENRTARARFYFGAAARPVVIAIHGYMGGNWLFEETSWPIDWFRRRGLDVVLPVLPMHAGRGNHQRGAPAFPGSDPRLAIEGFRQVVHDVRSIAAFLRARGAPHVGIAGMSLGGYASALLATVAPEVDFVLPIVPLASIADFARDHGRLDSHEMHVAIERAYAPVSPLSRPLLCSPERALVIGGEEDRITPIAHATRIAEHFGCEMIRIEGGHLLQVGRGSAFRTFAGMLERVGILS